MNRPMSPAPENAEVAGPLLGVCNAMVGVYKQAFGRGPTKARAHFAGPDLLVVLLEHTLTVGERNLVALGQHERLRELRLFTHYALEDELRSIVERALDRRTIAFMSGIDIRRDLSVELMTLEPLRTFAGSRAHC